MAPGIDSCYWQFFLQVLQWLADSWCSSIGSVALSIIIAFFESQDDLKDSDENRAKFAEYALDKLQFCYKKADGDDEEVSAPLACMVYIHTNTTQRRIFGDFTKAPLLFKHSANIFLQSMVLKLFLVFMIRVPGHIGLSHYQLHQYVIFQSKGF